MSTQTKSPRTQTKSAFGLKGNLMTLTVMQLFETQIDAIAEQLEKTVASTPKFFNQMPIVIDLQHLLNAVEPIDFKGLNKILRQQGLIPVGVCNGSPDQLSAASAAGLGTLSQIKKDQSPIEQPAKPSPRSKAAPKTDEPPTQSASKVVLSPVRSGQQVYAKGGDLIILASVSAGAEILADGHIHVYGTLRGRALAGVKGNTSARIFCTDLQAELISIAGHYKLQEQIEKLKSPAPVQIYIEEDQLQISHLV